MNENRHYYNMKLKYYITLVLIAVFGLSLLANLLIYGSIGRIPIVGAVVTNKASEEDRLLWLYIKGGYPLTALKPLQDLGFSLGEMTGDFSWEKVSENPRFLTGIVTGEYWNNVKNALSFNYWLTPSILFLLLGMLVSSLVRTDR